MVKGGNTDSVYKHGTHDKSKMIRDVHPDVAKMIPRYGRLHHFVNYNKFKYQQLKRKKDYTITEHEWKMIEKKGSS